MIIKKFVDRDSRSAMARVRDELGADAVVLSSRSVGDSFEMVAAANYDEYDVVTQLENGQPVKTDFAESKVRVRPETLPEPVKVSESILAQVSNESLGVARQDEPKGRVQSAAERASNSHQNSASRSSQGRHEDDPTASRTRQDEGPTLQTLQTELSNLRKLLQEELPKLSKRAGKRKSMVRSTVRSRLARMGFSAHLCAELVEKISVKASLDVAWKQVLQAMTARVRESDEKLIEQGGIAAFVGPSGAGKTSTIAKIAVSRLTTHGRGNIGLITTNAVKGVANERLLKFAKAMDIPCREATTATMLKSALDEFSAMKLVLIDTPGMDANDLRLAMQLAEFRLASSRIKTYLVLPADKDSGTLEKTINAFTRYSPVGVVVTHVDTSQRLSGVVEVLMRKRLPLSFISNGTRIPADLSEGHASELIKAALRLLKTGIQEPVDSSAALAEDGDGQKRPRRAHSVSRDRNVTSLQLATG